MQFDTSHMSLGLLTTKLETSLITVMMRRQLVSLLERWSGSEKAEFCKTVRARTLNCLKQKRKFEI